ncbi:MAG TPA: restriction endonuclease, SacI family [Parvibaculum sp.]|jgi:hypothetical protein
MAIRFKKAEASALLESLAQKPIESPVSIQWAEKIQRLSELCAKGISKTHIAFLGTELLAKSLNKDVDLMAIKPKWAPKNPRAFSARSLAHSVLVPASAKLGFHLGVTGREPLNNQPYFRMTALDDGTPIHPGAREAFDYMLGLVRELQTLDHTSAKAALSAYIAVRKNYIPTHSLATVGQINPNALISIIQTFVGEKSDGGKRAQAVAAGLMDVFAGPDRILSGRINDPSRKAPGDVRVLDPEEGQPVEKAIEVRDKPVQESDIQLFCLECAEAGVHEAAVLMVNRQQEIDEEKVIAEAETLGVGLTLFKSWDEFIHQVLFWSDIAKLDAATQAVDYIYDRLVNIEAPAEAIERWNDLIST